MGTKNAPKPRPRSAFPTYSPVPGAFTAGWPEIGSSASLESRLEAQERKKVVEQVRWLLIIHSALGLTSFEADYTSINYMEETMDLLFVGLVQHKISSCSINCHHDSQLTHLPSHIMQMNVFSLYCVVFSLVAQPPAVQFGV